ncbi:hypothetical protein R3P38DRAFT_3230800 [Favolaschia claudopus]|uniref:Uncharacterized protein n=1 Tax=Favolaschia claudopus TaxID=2862362 RepID=A0AAV9ZM84_9AGAR
MIPPAEEKLARRRARLARQVPSTTPEVTNVDPVVEERWQAMVDGIFEVIKLWGEGKLEPAPKMTAAERAEEDAHWKLWDEFRASSMDDAPPWEVLEWQQDVRNYEEWMPLFLTIRTAALQYTVARRTPISRCVDFTVIRPHKDPEEVLDNNLDEIPDLIEEDDSEEAKCCCRCAKRVVKAKL